MFLIPFLKYVRNDLSKNGFGFCLMGSEGVKCDNKLRDNKYMSSVCLLFVSLSSKALLIDNYYDTTGHFNTCTCTCQPKFS